MQGQATGATFNDSVPIPGWPLYVFTPLLMSKVALQLVLEQLACGYGERALFNGLEVTLTSGSITRVIGENGSGKTTLLRAVAGLHRPLVGRIDWQGPTGTDGEPVELRAALCFVGHDNALNAALTPVENLDLMTRLAGRPAAVSTIAQTLSGLGLKRVRHKACRQLSAGQKRRVSLARLWLTDAPLWLLDEPGAALDADSRARLGARIAEHAAAGGIVLFTTHEDLPLGDARVEHIALTPC